MKNIKWQTIGIGIAAIVVVVWWMPKNKTLIGNKTWEMQKAGENYVDNYLPIELKTPRELEWKLNEFQNFDKAETWYVSNQIGEEVISRFLSEVGLKAENKTTENGGLVVFDNKQGKSGYINLEKKELSFSQEITSKGQLKSSQINDLGRIKDDLMLRLAKINGKDGEINWKKVTYQKMVFPRWVESSEKEAQAIELKGDYVIGGKNLETYYGNSVQMTVRRDGVLLKLVMVKYPDEIKTEITKEAVKKEELAVRRLDAFGVVLIEGGENFGQNWEIDEIGKITINSAEPVLIFDPRGGRIRPYYLLSGNAWSRIPIKVMLITSAVK